MEVGVGGGDELAEEVESVGAGEECECGIVEDFAGEGWAIGFGDVGEVCGDEVEGAGDL